MKQVESYFKSYPNDECFTTSDGMVFHKKGDANLHATSLDDKEVIPHKRSKYLAAEKQTKAPAAKGAKGANGKTADAGKAEGSETVDPGTGTPE